MDIKVTCICCIILFKNTSCTSVLINKGKSCNGIQFDQKLNIQYIYFFYWWLTLANPILSDGNHTYMYTLIPIFSKTTNCFSTWKQLTRGKKKREIQQQALAVLVKTIKSLASSIIDLPVQFQEVKFPSIYNHQRKPEKSLHIIVV